MISLAESVFVEWAQRQSSLGTDTADLDLLCKQRPDMAAELRRLHELWQRANHAFESLNEAEPGASAPAGDERYEVRDAIAEGGMGAIYEVWDRQLQRTLAMKVVRGKAPLHRAIRRTRLLNEAQILGRLVHPAIVPVHEVGRDAAGELFFTMQLVQGRHFGAVIDAIHSNASTEWTITRGVGIVLRVCEAIAHAHEKGVVHRDLKPENIMVGGFGETYVMDWGLAKTAGDPSSPQVSNTGPRASADDEASPLLTMAGDVLGTPAYMPPEQAEGRVDEVDERSDIYSAGALLYHLLTGRQPYANVDGDATSIVQAVVDGPPRRIESITRNSPAEIVAICERAMARDSGTRYQSAYELADDLRAFLERRVVRAHRTGAIVELQKWVMRNKGAAVAVLIGILAAIAFAVRESLSNAAIEKRAETLRRRVYGNDIVLAANALRDGDILVAQQILSGCPEDLRRWEWRRLVFAADNSDRTLGGPVGGAVAFTRDGRLVAIGGSETTLSVWNTRDWTCAHRLRVPKYVEGIEFSADNRSLWTVSRDGRLRRWNLDEAELEVEVRCSGKWLGAIALSPDGRRLAIGCHEGRVTVRPVDSPDQSVTIASGLNSVDQLVWSADGETIWAGLWDNTVREFDVKTAKERRVLRGHTHWTSGLALSPNQEFLASSDRHGRSIVWNAKTGEERFRLPVAPGMRRVAWSHDSRFIVDGARGSVRVFDTQSFEQRERLTGVGDAISVTCAPDRPLVVISGEPGTRIFDLEHATRREELCATRDRRVHSIAFRPRSHECAFLVQDVGVEIWDWHRRDRLRVLRTRSTFGSINYTPDGTAIVLADRSGKLTLYGANDAREHRTWSPHPKARGIDGIASHPAIGVASSGRDGRVIVWNLHPLTKRWETNVDTPAWPDGVGECAFSPDGEVLAVAAHQAGLILFDSRTGVERTRLRGTIDRPATVDFSPDGKRLATGSPYDNQIAVWDVETQRELWRSEAPRDPRDPRFSGSGERILSIGASGELTVWNAATGERIVRLKRGGDDLEVLRRIPGTDTFVTGGVRGSIRFWTVPRLSPSAPDAR